MSTTLKVRSFPTKFLLIVSTARQHRWVFSVQLGSLPQSLNPQQRPSGNCYHWGWTHGISSSSSMQKLCWEGQQWWCLHLLCAKHPTYLILGPCKRGITISICQESKLRLSLCKFPHPAQLVALEKIQTQAVGSLGLGPFLQAGRPWGEKRSWVSSPMSCDCPVTQSLKKCLIP